ncbi:MAG: HAD family hydrolase [Thomasclavelia sp.]|nr:HAD family hydrolase [Thomasclavelia sp.]
MNIKLIATDMDGTLLNNEHQFDEEFIEVFFKLKEKNIRFVVASGNQYYRLYQLFLPMSKDIIFIAENGSMIVDGEKLLCTNPLFKKDVNTTIDILKRFDNLRVVMCGEQSAYALKKEEDFEEIVKRHYCNYKMVNSLKEIDDSIIKFSINDPQNQIKKYLKDIEENLPEGLRIVTSGNEWMDIQCSDTNKGEGMKVVQKLLNVSKDECMVFGDQMNDFEMFKEAKYSYAMKNAVQDLKNIAYDICDSNDEKGVIKTIEKKVL